jgi:hypothetical protein
MFRAERRVYIDRRLVATPKFVIASLRRLFGWAVLGERWVFYFKKTEHLTCEAGPPVDGNWPQTFDRPLLLARQLCCPKRTSEMYMCRSVICHKTPVYFMPV